MSCKLCMEYEEGSFHLCLAVNCCVCFKPKAEIFKDTCDECTVNDYIENITPMLKDVAVTSCVLCPDPAITCINNTGYCADHFTFYDSFNFFNIPEIQQSDIFPMSPFSQFDEEETSQNDEPVKKRVSKQRRKKTSFSTDPKSVKRRIQNRYAKYEKEGEWYRNLSEKQRAEAVANMSGIRSTHWFFEIINPPKDYNLYNENWADSESGCFALMVHSEFYENGNTILRGYILFKKVSNSLANLVKQFPENTRFESLRGAWGQYFYECSFGENFTRYGTCPKFLVRRTANESGLFGKKSFKGKDYYKAITKWYKETGHLLVL